LRRFLKMNLIIDIGNTRTKLAFFEKNILIEKANVEALTLDALSDLLKGRNVEGVIMSVSGQDTEGVEVWLRENYFFIKLNHETPLPIENQYDTPQTLGKDRLASAVAAHFLCPQKTCLVIDSGTALTFNLLTEKGAFVGGNITAGLKMRLKALHHFTAKLPLLEQNMEGSDIPNTFGTEGSAYAEIGGTENNLIGKNTNDAILKGVQLGILSEIEGFILRFRKKQKNIQVILTGGDGLFLKKNLQVKNTLHEPNLVLIGLNQILNYNLHLKKQIA
jgi:type III pantothenate kinase